MMHNLVQCGKLRSQVINIPEGLPELLSDIAREVLRCQPTTECLCHFIIDYLHSIINARDKAKIAKSIIDRALRIVDEVIADLCICNISKEKSDYMSEAMEECFKRFLEQRRCEKGKNKEMIKFGDFDMLDELMAKCKFTAEELKISKPVIETAYKKFVNAYLSTKENAADTDCLYQYLQEREKARIEQRLREESAIKIQSNFRGYLVRKSLFSKKQIELCPPSPPPASDNELDENQLNLAALKIQRFYRRYKGEVKCIDIEGTEKKTSQDDCSPASNITLTAGPADHPDAYDENQIQRQHENQEQNELLESNINEIDEGAAEELMESNTHEAGKEVAEELMESNINEVDQNPTEELMESNANEADKNTAEELMENNTNEADKNAVEELIGSNSNGVDKDAAAEVEKTEDLAEDVQND